MSKFKKQKKGLPPISTASLPDIVFMLLFFFMVSTTMRETELKIKQPNLPEAHDVKKFEHKNLVSTIYVGKSIDESKKGDFIQLNDKIARVSDVQNFIFKKRQELQEEEVPFMTTLFKADVDAKVGTIADIKRNLREIDALKISYAAVGKND
jgi:biopolymer transport protein ExbD